MGAVALLVVAALVGMLSTVAVFARNEVLNTDRYVQTVAPLATDPTVTNAVAERVTDEIMARLDVDSLIKQLVDKLGGPAALDALAAPLENSIRSFVDKETHAIVDSPRFAQFWDAANRSVHDELDAILTTGHGKYLTTDGTEVSLDLGPIVAAVKQRLVDAGLGLAAKIPDTTATYPLFSSPQLPKARHAVKLLNVAAWVLPILGLLLLVAGIAVAPNRRRGLLIGALLFGLGMLLLLGALAVARSYYLDDLPPAIHSADAARVVYDTVLRFLVAGAQTLAVLAGIVVVACWAAGPGRVAVALRRGVAAGLDALARWLTRIGVHLGGVPSAVRQFRGPIEVGFVVLGLLWLVVWRHPGIGGTLWVTVAVLAAVALVELVARLGDDGHGAGRAGTTAAATS